ncbi:hypothetical protein ITJ43_11610 [Microbacterium sp. VKM Ac-2870]|uniref:arsenate reductase/protein-tyrosine-phosphatase family protein n=1 Tax=Microbacterium sp. VKM Ac-2870 TaxID=2783825 RepID=UPI00188BBFE8|nr:hypothetical protein [Microbacterium sp. VKM Ac-2870]MBF4562786.1 hypothetical protein [Microbacterium sp. VKM Ac-2870]
MSQRILVVCAQNVCRSPYLAATVGAELDRLDAGYLVVSRGVRAESGQPMCDIARASLPPEAAERGDAHRSRPLKVGDVERAALILTATTRERGAIALLDASARARTFTVREFILLAASAESAPLEGLSALGADLHRRRALLASTPPPARGLFGRRAAAASPVDIPDAHRESAARHRALFARLRADADQVVQIVSAAVA